jgi:hypothetical protein
VNRGRVGVRFVTCILLLMSAAAAAAAQESAGAVYVKAGMSFLYQAPQEAPSAPPFAAPGGMTVGWLVGGGVFLSRAISAEFDFARTGVMTSPPQRGRHNTSEIGSRRDAFVSFGVKGHFPLGSSLRVEPTAGLWLIRGEGSVSTISGGARQSLGPRWRPGLMFGADLRMISGRHLAFLPGLRLAVSGAPFATWRHHYPKWTLRPSLAVAVGF